MHKAFFACLVAVAGLFQPVAFAQEEGALCHPSVLDIQNNAALDEPVRTAIADEAARKALTDIENMLNEAEGPSSRLVDLDQVKARAAELSRLEPDLRAGLLKRIIDNHSKLRKERASRTLDRLSFLLDPQDQRLIDEQRNTRRAMVAEKFRSQLSQIGNQLEKQLAANRNLSSDEADEFKYILRTVTAGSGGTQTPEETKHKIMELARLAAKMTSRMKELEIQGRRSSMPESGGIMMGGERPKAKAPRPVAVGSAASVPVSYDFGALERELDAETAAAEDGVVLDIITTRCKGRSCR